MALEKSNTEYLGKTVTETCDYEWYPDFSFALGGGGPGAGTYRGSGPNPYNNCYGECLHKIVDDILPFRTINDLTGKSKCVFEKLEQKNGNLFKQTIGKFVKDPKYNLFLQNGNCPTTDTACTNGTNISTTGNVTIENNNLTDIDMAATILHEGIQAELWRYVAQFKSGINPNDKKEIFKYYTHYANYYGDVFDNNQNNAKNDIDHIYDSTLRRTNSKRT